MTNTARRDAPQMGGLVWANVGLQQAHLPYNDALETENPTQTLRGEIVLSWPSEKIPDLENRLASHGYAMEGKKFMGPYGNRFVIESGESKFGPGTSLIEDLPGGPTEGHGIQALRFDVPSNTAKKICNFYDAIFDMTTRYDGVCHVPIGNAQAMDFVESDALLPPYDGHHVAVYLNGPAFLKAYTNLAQRRLIFNNPRFPQFSYDTLDDALLYNEFRLKNIIDLSTGNLLYELEHEIRNLRHPGFDPLRHRLSSPPSSSSSSSSGNNHHHIDL